MTDGFFGNKNTACCKVGGIFIRDGEILEVNPRVFFQNLPSTLDRDGSEIYIEEPTPT